MSYSVELGMLDFKCVSICQMGCDKVWAENGTFDAYGMLFYTIQFRISWMEGNLLHLWMYFEENSIVLFVDDMIFGNESS